MLPFLLKFYYNCTYYYNSFMWFVQNFKVLVYPICDKEISIALCVHMCNEHYKLITTLTKLPKTDDNYGILAFEHVLTHILRGGKLLCTPGVP